MSTFRFNQLYFSWGAALCAVFLAVSLRASETETSGSVKPDTSIDTGAEVVELPAKKATKAEKPKPLQIDTGIDEDILKERATQAAKKAAVSTPKPLEPNKPTLPDSAPKPAPVITEPGFASVLTGTLKADTEISAESMPHLIRGVLVIPAKVTLKINAGATVHLRSDDKATKPTQSDLPDPTKSAVVWVYGTLIVAGESGKPVEFQGLDKDTNASVLMYGNEQSRIDGSRFKGVDLAQSGGVCHWTNCEFNDSKYYALASGAGIFTHCSFKKCGGIFAAYEEGPWALLTRKCLFENCRDGLMFGRDPGQACLNVEKNNFISTRGANLRMMPRSASSGALSAKGQEELLIGENWYGTRVEEEIDHRIVDNRSDRAIKAHLNTRAPAEKPYQNVGAGVGPTITALTLQEQQTAVVRMIQTLASAKQKSAMEKKVAIEKTSLKKELK